MLHPLNNIEIINYFNYKPRFNSVFSRHNLPRIKYEAYVINLDDKKSKGNIRKGNKWNIINNVSLFIDRNTAA